MLPKLFAVSATSRVILAPRIQTPTYATKMTSVEETVKSASSEKETGLPKSARSVELTISNSVVSGGKKMPVHISVALM